MVAKYADLTPEEKKRRNKSNAASIAKYNAKSYDRLGLRVRKDGADGFTRDDLEAAAKADGQSVNSYILEAIREKMGI